MKKNLMSAIVIFFITIAVLLMIDDISKNKNTQLDHNIDVYDVPKQPDLVITDDL
jgi:hypothetical protein